MRMRKKTITIIGIVMLFTLPACSLFQFAALVPVAVAGPAYTEIPVSSSTPEAVLPLVQTPAVPPTQEPVPTDPPAPTATAAYDPYQQYSIDYLSSRLYGTDGFRVETVLDSNSYFTRTLISYPSDGLRIYGFMDTPRRGQPPYPVVIAVHGYTDPSTYNTLDYTTTYADALARAGYLVIHPNLRDYPPSDNGPDLFRIGMAVDVLNLISIVRFQGGASGPLQQANPISIGLWGHSMGGGIVLRAITVSKYVRAAVLYGAMSGDEKQNFQMIDQWSGNKAILPELAVPDDVVLRISPINYLDRISAAVSINHGEADPLVPLAWSVDLYHRLQALNKQVEFNSYPGEGHVFTGEGNDLFEQSMISFFDRTLR